MIILLTGASGVGKSEAAAIARNRYFERMVNIDNLDYFSMKKPF